MSGTKLNKLKLRNYAITIHNKTLDDIKDIDMELVKYLILGEEIGKETKRLHLQGYIELFKPQRIDRIKNMFNDKTIHLEKRKGTRLENRRYCSKDGKFKEWGNFDISQGVRTDLLHIKQLLEEKKKDDYILDNYPIYIHRYYKFINHTRDILQNKLNKQILESRIINKKLYDYQQLILDKLLNQNDRTILYVKDFKGNTGKSFLCDYILYHYDSILFTNAKSSDIAYAYNGETYILFDFSRTIEGHINYSIVEHLKNGRIFSTKYNSKIKIFNIPKIVIMANFLAELDKLSRDRWDILDLDILIWEKQNIEDYNID